MTCFQLYSSLLPIHVKLKPQHHNMGQTTKLLWGTIPQSQHFLNFPSECPIRMKALPHFIVVAATTPPKPGDLPSFLTISAFLLSLYFLANFVVPEFLVKYFGFDKQNEGQKVDDVDTIEDK